MSDDLVKRLKARISDAGLDAADAMNEAIARIEALQADNARLRAALSMIAVMGFSDDIRVSANIARMAVHQSRAALNTGKEPSHE